MAEPSWSQKLILPSLASSQLSQLWVEVRDAQTDRLSPSLCPLLGCNDVRESCAVEVGRERMQGRWRISGSTRSTRRNGTIQQLMKPLSGG